MKRTILYDIGFLIRTCGAPTPTGIERVDLRYLLYFLNDPETELHGVVLGRGGSIVMLPDEATVSLAKLLHRRWIDADYRDADAAEARRIKHLRSKCRRHSLLWPLRLDRGPREARRVDPALKRISGPIWYFNTAHQGYRDGRIYAALRKATGARLAFYLHDMLPTDYYNYFQDGVPERHDKMVRVMATQGDLILTNSACSQSRIAAFLSEHALPAPPLKVLHIGTEDRFFDPPRRESETPPYFLALGTMDPRKNIPMLLKIWARMMARGGTVPELRLIGRRGWVTEENHLFETLLAPVTGKVHEMGRINDRDMRIQLAGARALLFPSRAEGWGIPLVEALTMGTPAIASDIAVFHEASQGYATFCPPDDIDAWERAILAAAALTPDQQAHRRAALAGFTPPTWAAHFAALEETMATL